jgi:hypothetical protein
MADFTGYSARVLEVRRQLHALDPQVPGSLDVRVLGHQPLPSDAAPVDVVRHERDLRERLASGEITAYRPMPPFPRSATSGWPR